MPGFIYSWKKWQIDKLETFLKIIWLLIYIDLCQSEFKELKLFDKMCHGEFDFLNHMAYPIRHFLIRAKIFNKNAITVTI